MEGRCKLLHDRVAVRTAFETTPRRDPRAAPRVPVALAPCATTIRVYRARPRPRAWPECRERVRRPAPRHPLWGRSAPPQRVGPHPSNKTSQLLMLRQSERQRRPPRGWRRGSRSGPRVRAAANAPARNRMRRGGPAFALLRTVLLMTRENPRVRAYWLPTFFYPILVGRTQVERRKTHNFDQVKPFTRADFTRPRRHGQHL